MTVENNNISGRSNEPEQIDLIDLMVQIWRGKVTIIICIIVAIALAVGYLAVAKEKWTSTAIITQPGCRSVSDLYQCYEYPLRSGCAESE